MTTIQHKAPALLPVSDQRTVREIMLDLEAKVTAAVVSPLIVKEAEPPPPKERTLTFPKRLSDKAREAIRVVLDDAKARRTTLTFTQLIDGANGIEPNSLNPGGDTNDSIRAFCAELCGINQRWAN